MIKSLVSYPYARYKKLYIDIALKRVAFWHKMHTIMPLCCGYFLLIFEEEGAVLPVVKIHLITLHQIYTCCVSYI